MKILLLLLLVTSCASKVWVMDQFIEGGGVLGYKGANKPDFKENFDRNARNLCGGEDYQVVSRGWHYKEPSGFQRSMAASSASLDGRNPDIAVMALNGKKHQTATIQCASH